MEGTCYSILTLTIKVCLALGTAVGLIFVQASGYYDGLATGTFDLSTKNIIFFAYTALPGILALLSIIPMIKYDVVGAKKAEISRNPWQRKEKFSNILIYKNTPATNFAGVFFILYLTMFPIHPKHFQGLNA